MVFAPASLILTNYYLPLSEALYAFTKVQIMRWISLVFFTLAFSANAEFKFCEDFSPYSAKGNDGKETKLIIPGSKIFNSVGWQPELALEPSLSPLAVHDMAVQWAVNNLPKYDGVDITSISLKKYGCMPPNTQKKYWYYLVEYNPIINGNSMFGSGTWLAVLLSGEVIAPVRI